MKKLYLKKFLMFVIISIFLAACTPLDNLSQGIAEKSISGSGTLALNKVGLNSTTQTPEVFSLFVIGDYASHDGEADFGRIEYVEDGSIFNSNAKSRHYKAVFFTKDSNNFELLKSQANEDIQKIIQAGK